MVPVDAVENIPSAEQWTSDMESSSPEEAVGRWQFANTCLHTADCLHSDEYMLGWGRLIGIAEGVLRDRGIDPHVPVVLVLPNPASLTEVAQQRGMSVQEVKEHHARLVKDGKARMDGERFISLDEAGNDREPIIIDNSELPAI
jgi:hypothetical protein